MKKHLLAIVAVILAVAGLHAETGTAVFNFVSSNPYGWDDLPKDASGYVKDSAKPFVCTEAPATITLDGKFRRNAQKVYGLLECLLMYNGTTMSFATNSGYKMNTITIYGGGTTLNNLVVSVGNVEMEEAVETDEVYVHSETGATTSQVYRTIVCNTAGPITITNPTSTTQIVTSVVIAYETLDKKEAGLSFSSSECIAYMGGENTFPTVNNPNNLEIDFSSDDESIAKVDAATGAVTLVAPGTTKIYVGTNGNSEYDWGEAFYTLTVKRNSEVSAFYNFNEITVNDDGTGYMTNYPDIPYTTWWTTNPDTSYGSGAHFKPLTITESGTQITFDYDGGDSHGNVRATVSTKVSNLQLGKSACMTIKTTDENNELYDVIIKYNNANSTWDSLSPEIKTNDNGTLTKDASTYTITWTPATSKADCYIDARSGAYIISITANYKDNTQVGVEDIIANNNDGTEYWYNLQGVRVNGNSLNPGLYIKVCGGKSSKILVK